MDNLSDDIIKYKKGLLSAKEMHTLEKRALNDPFLAEALEGSDNISNHEFTADVDALNSKIKSRRRIIFTPLRLAAGLLLIAASVFLIYQLAPQKENIALHQDKPQETKQSTTQPKVKEPEKIVLAPEKKETAPATSRKEISRPHIKEKQEPEKEHQAKPEIESVAKNDLAKKTEAEELKDISAEQKPEEVAAPVYKQDSGNAAIEEKADKKIARAFHYSTQGAGLAKQASKYNLTGIVVSAEDGSVIPGVNVVLKGTTVGTATDASGSFSITTNENNPVLDFSFIGYQSKEIETQGQNSFVVKLETDVTQLSEVVVTQVATPSGDTEPVVIYAEPVGGRKAYNKYLETNVRYPAEALKNNIKGKARVEFILHSDGSFDQYNIVKSVGYGCDDELIRLIKEGPKWKPTTVNGVPSESKVRVGLRFDPAKAGR